MLNLLLFTAGISLSALGALFLKIGGTSLGKLSLNWHGLLTVATNKFVILGFILYFVPALIWVYLLGKYPLSFVQPIIALTYAITPILALIVLKEPISVVRWVGIVVIVVGIFIVSRTG